MIRQELNELLQKVNFAQSLHWHLTYNTVYLSNAIFKKNNIWGLSDMGPLGQRNIDNCCGSASVQKIISFNLCIIKPTQVSNEKTNIFNNL